MKADIQVIDLQEFRTPGSKVFTGRDRGEQDRKRSKIDELVDKPGKIDLIIPPDIYSINPSYLEEFLVNVVQKLKKDGFFNKFKIVNNGPYKISRDLNEAIDRILREDHALI
ncbi:MAG: DUF4325 domain-containing protein [Cyclobacteriaceae bacterium]